MDEQTATILDPKRDCWDCGKFKNTGLDWWDMLLSRWFCQHRSSVPVTTPIGRGYTLDPNRQDLDYLRWKS